MTTEERLSLIRLKVQLKPKQGRRKGRNRVRLARWKAADRERRIKAGKCVRCPSPASPGKRECATCLARRPPSRERMRALRDKRVAAGQCIRCAAPREDFGPKCDCGNEKALWSRGCESCGGGKVSKVCEECR